MTLYPEGTQKPSASLKHPSTHLRATPSFYIRLFIKTDNVNPSSELRQIVSFHFNLIHQGKHYMSAWKRYSSDKTSLFWKFL